MTRFEEYQLLFYQKELEKKEKMIEELIWENRVLARANLKLVRENSMLSNAIANRYYGKYKIIQKREKLC